MSQQEGVEDSGTGTMPRSDMFGSADKFDKSSGIAWPARIHVMLAAMIILAVISQFFRSSNGVIAPAIMGELQVDEAAMGLSSGAFFIIFAVLQIPIGVLFDKYGARLVVSSMLIFAIAGSVLFSVAQTIDLLVAGRFLIGLGLAGGMVGSLVILSRWHNPTDFTRAMTILFASANLGSLLATAPLAASSEWIGWRSTFIALAILTAIVGIFFYLVVRDAPAGAEENKRGKLTLIEAFKGVAQVFRVPGLLCVMPLIALGYASVITIIGLWGAPYLDQVYGMSTLDSGNILMVFAIFFIAGTLAYGPIQRRVGSFRRVVVAGGILTGALMLVLAVFVDAPLIVTVTLLVLISIIGAFSVILMGHGVALIPSSLVGRGTTTLNGVLMGGTALLQIGSGAAVETAQNLFASPAAGYSAFFGGLGLLMLIATVIYLRAPEPEKRS